MKFTEAQVEKLVKAVMRETTTGIMNWLGKEIIVIDPRTKEKIKFAQLTIRKGARGIHTYVDHRMKKHGLTFARPKK